MKKMGEIRPEIFHFEEIGVGSSNNFGSESEKKETLKQRDSCLKLMWVE